MASYTEKNTQVEIISEAKIGVESNLELGSRGSDSTKYALANQKITVSRNRQS